MTNRQYVATALAVSVLFTACGGGSSSQTASITGTTNPTPAPGEVPSPTPTPPGGSVPTPAPGVTMTPTPSSPLPVGVTASRYASIPATSSYPEIDYFPRIWCVKDLNTGLTWTTHPFSGTNLDSTTMLQITIPPTYSFGPESYGYATQSQIDGPGTARGIANDINRERFCGYSNWRLPTETELKTLLTPGAIPAIDTTVLNLRTGIFWTSTNSPPLTPRYPHLARTVDFRGEGVYWFQEQRDRTLPIMYIRN